MAGFTAATILIRGRHLVAAACWQAGGFFTAGTLPTGNGELFLNACLPRCLIRFSLILRFWFSKDAHSLASLAFEEVWILSGGHKKSDPKIAFL